MDDSRYVALSYFLRRYCADHKLTQYQLAEIIDVSVTSVYNWIHCRQKPTRTSWNLMIDALGDGVKQIMLEE